MVVEKSKRKCIIKDKGYQRYCKDIGVYVSNLYQAKIFNESEIPEFMKNNSEDEIIFLDTKEGLELVLKEIEVVQGQINLWEGRVNEMKKGLDELYQTNPEIINEYITQQNKRHYRISNEEKDMILNTIIEGKL